MDENLNSDEIRRVNEGIADMAEALSMLRSGFTKMAGDSIRASKANSDNTDAVNQGPKAYRSLYEGMAKSNAVRKLEEEAIRSHTESIARWERVGAGASTVATSLASSLLSANTNFSKLNGTVDSVTSTLSSFAKSYGTVGTILGTFIDILGFGVKKITDYGDKLLTASDDLASMGTAGQLTTEQIMEMGKGAQYTSATLGGWIKATKSLGTDMIGLSGTVAGGVKSFADMTSLTEDQVNNYRRLGVSQEQLTQNQADYVKLQMRSGTLITEQMKISGALKKASLEYTDNLLALSAITGQSVEKLKEEQERSLADSGIQLKLNLMQQEATRLTREGASEEEKARGEKILAEKKQYTELLQMVARIGDPKLLAGAQRRIAGGGWDQTSASLLNLMGPQFDERLSKIQSGAVSDQRTFLKEAADAVNQRTGQLGPTMAFNPEGMDTFGLSIQSITNATLYGAKTQAEINDMLDKSKIEAIAKGEQVKDSEGRVDKALEAHIELLNKSRQIQNISDAGVQAVINASGGYKEALMVATLAAGGLAAAAVAAAGALGLLSLSGLKNLNLPSKGGPSPGQYKLPGGIPESGGASSSTKIGKMLRLGKGLAGGAGGLLGGLALDYGADKLDESGHEKWGAAAKIGSSTVSGAGTGAMLGSIAGPPGAAIGGIIGGVSGAAYGLYKNFSTLTTAKEKEEESTKKLTESVGEVTTNLSVFNKELAEAKKALSGVASSPTYSGAYSGAPTDNSKKALDFFKNKGWSPEQAAGIVGNLQQESGVNLKTTAHNKQENAQGIAQWRNDRLDAFKSRYKKEMKDASLEEQLDFVHHELMTTESKAGNLLKTARTVAEATSVIDKRYERSSGAHLRERTAYANALVNQQTSSYPAELNSNRPLAAYNPALKYDQSKPEQVTTSTRKTTSNAVAKEPANTPDINMIANMMMELLTVKLDKMIGQLDVNNDTQEKLLQYSRN